jgi:hypothetical protein
VTSRFDSGEFPPCTSNRSNSARHRPVDKFQPTVRADNYQQELAARLEHSRHLDKRLLDSLATQVIDGIAADHGVELSIGGEDLARVRLQDPDAALNARDLQVPTQQSFSISSDIVRAEIVKRGDAHSPAFAPQPGEAGQPDGGPGRRGPGRAKSNAMSTRRNGARNIPSLRIKSFIAPAGAKNSRSAVLAA